LVKQLNFRVDPGVNVMITGYVGSLCIWLHAFALCMIHDLVLYPY
jgi:hypothetical protein